MLKILSAGRRLAGISLLLGCCLLLTGCWDRKEIESRGYVLGIAIDMARPEPEDQRSILEAAQAAGSKKYKVSYLMEKVRTQNAGNNPAADEEEGMVYAAVGESLFATVRAVNTQFPSGLFFEDNQMLVFSEAVARDGIKDMMDFFDRDPEFRRRTRVFIALGRGEDLLRYKTKSRQLLSTYLPRITRNIDKSPTFAVPTVLGQVSEKIYNNQSLAIPIVIIDKEDIKVSGTALFDRNYKMVAALNEWETVGANILRRELQQGITVLPNPVKPDKVSVFELFQAEIEIKPHLAGDHLWFQLKAKFTGALAENQVAMQTTLDSAFLSVLEQSLVAEFTRQIRHAYARLQKSKADAAGLGALVHKRYPRYWKEVKSRWDEERFPEVPLKEVNIEVVIMNTAMVP